ncbi:protein phosphatase 2C domain-containing protein [Glaesserella parasuis]|nr:protein phosphatase 2C domain-containing protein [Glaesserella parasuis]MDP0340805.1 protein phosphatase 2C domain-containing protein [Glaesserella parasuis]MDP0356480.1 protein phosphatase 2C domain-containing protein [Glaesserella parasuis]
MTFTITFCQQAGKDKLKNQDALFNGNSVFQYQLKKAETIELNAEKIMLGVADGVSSSPKSYYASRFMMEQLAQCQQLSSAWLRQAQQALSQTLSSRYLGSATTFVACELTQDGKCKIINVGDSRAYKITAEGEWQQLSVDHTILNEMQQQGLADKQTVYSGLYNGLSDCLVADENETAFRIAVAETELVQGEAILLCSDGLSHYLHSDLLNKIWQQFLCNQERLTICRKMVKKHRYYDDFSVIICQF